MFALKDITCTRNEKIVVSQLTLSIPRGSGLLISGPNGVGKTTLLKVMAGILQPSNSGSSGNISFEGKVRKNGENYFGEKGNVTLWIGHPNGFFPMLSPRENLDWIIRVMEKIRNTMIDDEINEALDFASLSIVADRPLQELSSGQRARLILARLKLSRHPVWLLDEPATFLDASSKVLLNELIEGHLKNNKIAVIVTHNKFQMAIEHSDLWQKLMLPHNITLSHHDR